MKHCRIFTFVLLFAYFPHNIYIRRSGSFFIMIYFASCDSLHFDKIEMSQSLSTLNSPVSECQDRLHFTCPGSVWCPVRRGAETETKTRRTGRRQTETETETETEMETEKDMDTEKETETELVVAILQTLTGGHKVENRCKAKCQSRNS